MTDSEFTTIMTSMVAGIRRVTPWRTENLKETATQGETLAHGKYALTVSVRIAPYFYYVNENRKPCKRHGGETHYHYFDNAVNKQIEIIARKAGGYVKRG